MREAGPEKCNGTYQAKAKQKLAGARKEPPAGLCAHRNPCKYTARNRQTVIPTHDELVATFLGYRTRLHLFLMKNTNLAHVLITC